MVAVDEKLIRQRKRKIARALNASCTDYRQHFTLDCFAPSLRLSRYLLNIIGDRDRGENQNLDSAGNPDSLLHATSGFRHPCLPDLWLHAISGFRHPCLNLTTDQNGNTLKYDAWNRLVSVTNSSGQVIAQYSYDARGYPENGWCFKEIGTGLVSNDDPQGGSGVPAGTTNYPGAAAHTGSGRAGFRGVEHFDWLGSTPVPLNIYYDSQWQAIEVRTNPDWRFRPASGFRLPWLNAAGNVTSQTVWSAAYVNSPVLQDSFSGGVIQPNSRIYFLHDANWNTTAVVGYNSTTQTWGVTQRYIYSPYGSMIILNADFSAPPAGTQPISDYLYQGMTLDAVTGLYYARNRNYGPSLGVWISHYPLQYPGAAAQFRLGASAGFRWAEEQNAAATNPLQLNINGADTYQMEMSGPVGSVDLSGCTAFSGKGMPTGFAGGYVAGGNGTHEWSAQ